MIAGGYTQDETIFQAKLLDYDATVSQTSILAYYPSDNFEDHKLFQIYIYPSEIAVSTMGSVTAIATPTDSDPTPDLPMYAVLIDELNPYTAVDRSIFILLLEEESFAVNQEFELYLPFIWGALYTIDAQSLVYR